MITLDPRTVIFINFIYSFTVTVIVTFAWFLNIKRFKGLGNWTIAFLLLSGNFFILAFKGIIPTSFVIVIPHLLVGWAFVEIKRGLGKFLNIKNRLATDFIIIISFLIILLMNKSNAQLRIIVVVIFPTLIFIDIMYLVFRDPSVDSQTKKIIMYIFSIGVLVQSIRMYLGLKWDPNIDPLDTNNSLSIISVLFFVVNILILFVLLFLVIQKILMEEKKLLKKMEEVSITDELTQIYNRRGFLNLISYEFKRMRRKPNQYGFSILLADIDYFKKINDVYGHVVGDYVIKEISRILTENIKDTDIVARWGGEEFIIYLDNCSKENVDNVLERIRSRIENRVFMYQNKEIRITVSLGSVYTKNASVDIMKLFEIADKNLYQAKKNGRNTFVASGG